MIKAKVLPLLCRWRRTSRTWRKVNVLYLSNRNWINHRNIWDVRWWRYFTAFISNTLSYLSLSIFIFPSPSPSCSCRGAPEGVAGADRLQEETGAGVSRSERHFTVPCLPWVIFFTHLAFLSHTLKGNLSFSVSLKFPPLYRSLSFCSPTFSKPPSSFIGCVIIIVLVQLFKW